MAKVARKTMSLRQVKNIDQVCRLRRDNYDIGDWSIMTDGHTVWISKQKVGEKRTDHIEVPKSVFDKLLAKYDLQTPVGVWRDDKFHPGATV